MCVCLVVYTHGNVVARGGQKRAVDLQKLELQAVVTCPTWVLSPLQEQPVFLIAKPPAQSLGAGQAAWTPTAGPVASRSRAAHR